MTYLHKVAFPPAVFSPLLLEVNFKPNRGKIMFVHKLQFIDSAAFRISGVLNG